MFTLEPRRRRMLRVRVAKRGWGFMICERSEAKRSEAKRVSHMLVC